MIDVNNQYLDSLSKDQDYYFFHFRERLLERFKIDIGFDDYNTLCQVQIENIYPLSSNKSFGAIEIKGRKVWVIRDNFLKKLNTALDPNGEMPLPYRFKKGGITSTEFNEDVTDAIKQIKYLNKRYLGKKRVSEEDKKTFFIDKPEGLPVWMYHAAYIVHLGEEKQRGLMRRVVKNLYSL